jgi:hypothetical protein
MTNDNEPLDITLSFAEETGKTGRDTADLLLKSIGDYKLDGKLLARVLDNVSSNNKAMEHVRLVFNDRRLWLPIVTRVRCSANVVQLIARAIKSVPHISWVAEKVHKIHGFSTTL